MGLISRLLAAFADQFRQMVKLFIGNVLQKRMVRFFDQFLFVGIQSTRFLLSGDGHWITFLLAIKFPVEYRRGRPHGKIGSSFRLIRVDDLDRKSTRLNSS